MKYKHTQTPAKIRANPKAYLRIRFLIEYPVKHFSIRSSTGRLALSQRLLHFAGFIRKRISGVLPGRENLGSIEGQIALPGMASFRTHCPQGCRGEQYARCQGRHEFAA
jgi:hypothetical protein